MPKIKNVSPFGDLEVVGLGVIEHGSIIDVSPEQAADLLRQVDNFKPWGEPAQRAQRRGLAADEHAQETEGLAPITAEEGEAK